LGRAYRDGKGVEKNLDIAADWMRKASAINIGWTKNELFDILWKIDTPDSRKEMIAVATAFADRGNADAMGRLGRAYRDGKGVEKNLDLAADWMRKAADKNVAWAKNELFDILWKIDTPESKEEMISVAAAFADTGDGGAMGRLGRAYRDGRGVQQDLDTAAEWMRKAAEKNVGWAKNELFDILWKIDTPESKYEMIAVATAFAGTGDGNAMGRLGRAYRDGRGVQQDLDTAAEWMRKAAEKNVGWAKSELEYILKSIVDID
jgi:TPR repeat protein